MKSTIELAIEHAPKVLPAYIASVLVGMLRTPDSGIPALMDHKQMIATEILTIALSKAEG